jgi:hypothetical protein
MTNLGLSSLSSVQLSGQFGPHLTSLIWLTISAVLMYAGPATIAVIYLLLYDRSTIEVQSTDTADENQTAVDHGDDFRKAA